MIVLVRIAHLLSLVGNRRKPPQWFARKRLPKLLGSNDATDEGNSASVGDADDGENDDDAAGPPNKKARKLTRQEQP